MTPSAAPVSQRIKAFNAPLLPDKVPIKYALMAQDAFRFYRATCHLFYEDLSRAAALPYSPAVWMCGDLHVENFGSYKGDNRLVYFDLNDFDESILGPALWEAARMVTSIIVAFQVLGASAAEVEQAARLFIRRYAAGLAAGKARYVEKETARGIVRAFLENVCARKPGTLLQKHVCINKKNKIRFQIDGKRQLPLDPAFKAALIAHAQQWVAGNQELVGEGEVLDACFRIAGTGSVGIRRYAFLVRRLHKSKKVFRLLDMKQALPSSLHPYVMLPQPQWPSEAHRMIAIKTRMQNVSPAFLGTTSFLGNDFVLQEMQPAEDKITFNLINGYPQKVKEVIRDMALLTSSAQLRSAGRQQSAIADELIAFGQNDQWQEPLLAFALDYALQVSADYRQFTEDYHKGSFEGAPAGMAASSSF